jgi:polysaccharide chain length determinant protein (PEP-CTERM system associated)
LPEPAADFTQIVSRLQRIAVRRRWWIILTTFIVSIATIGVSLLLPRRYRSEATVFVESPRIPQQYVVPNSINNPMESLDAMTRDLLSRARLLQFASKYNLYPKLRTRLSPEALADKIRNDVEVRALTRDPERHTINLITVAFTADNPRTAQQVAGAVTDLFIHRNLQFQQNRDVDTTTFLRQQLALAKAKLDQEGSALGAYKARNLGQLPEQQASNLQILAGMQAQLQTTQSSLARAQQQRIYLESMLSLTRPTQANPASGAAPGLTPAETLQASLAKLRAQRDDLLSRFSSRYPDVISINQQIADQEAQLKRLLAEPSASPAKTSPSAVTASRSPAVIQLQSQLDANRAEIADDQKEIARLQTGIAGYQAKLNDAPVREQQISDMNRNYDLARQNYADLLNKVSQSELATRMAADEQSEQFQISDPPNLPRAPSSPPLEIIRLGGLAGGLVLGFALAFLVDTRDRSFHTEKDVRAWFSLPIVVGVPSLPTEAETDNKLRRIRREWITVSALLVVLLAAQFFSRFAG